MKLAPHTYFVDLFIALTYGLVWSIIFSFFLFSIYKKKDKGLLLFSFIINLYGGILQALIYDIFYNGGDNFEFAASASILYDIFWQDPLLYFQYFIAPFQDFIIQDEYFNKMQIFPHYWGNKSAFTTVVITSLFLISSFKMYYVTCIHIGLLDFFTSFWLYNELKKRYPKGYFIFLLGLFLFPSVWFWTAGVLKDSYTFIGLTLFIISMLKFQEFSSKLFFWFFLGFFGAFIAYYIKPYTILNALPLTGIWIALIFQKKQKNKLIKFLLGPYIIILLLGISIYITYIYSSKSPIYSLESLIETIEMKRRDLLSDYYYKGRLGSRYDIGKVTEDPITLIKKIPIALLTGYFRPFLFESRNILMFAASLETLSFLVTFLYVILKIPLKGWFQAWRTNPDFVFFMTYSIFFIYWVTLSAGNFGNLVRYRVPGITTLFIALGIIFHEIKENSTKKRVITTYKIS